MLINLFLLCGEYLINKQINKKMNIFWRNKDTEFSTFLFATEGCHIQLRVLLTSTDKLQMDESS